MSNARIHPTVKELAAHFREKGKQAYLVGGAVRDLARGMGAKDWDIATDARPEEVMGMFRRVIPTGIKHGTVTILYKGLSLETTTFRTESGYADGRHPDQVEYAATIEEDLSRRDFTMNALAQDILTGRIVDPWGGAADIRDRVIRCVGDPAERFSEDGLRPLRAVRFAAQLGFRIEDRTLAAIGAALPTTARIAKERIRDELDKMLGSRKPSIGLRLMEQTGLLGLILPELAACRGIDQKGFHRFDVLDHSFFSCDGAPGDRLILRWAALLHDTGKALTMAVDGDGCITFYRHEEHSARIVRSAMNRLRYSKEIVESVAHLVLMHMFHYEPSWNDAAVRRLIVRVGKGNLEDLLELRRADSYGMGGIEAPPDLNASLAGRIAGILEQENALTLKDLAINGNDLAALGISKGPRMGIILQELFQTILDDPAMNDKDALSALALKLNRRYSD